MYRAHCSHRAPQTAYSVYTGLSYEVGHSDRFGEVSSYSYLNDIIVHLYLHGE